MFNSLPLLRLIKFFTAFLFVFFTGFVGAQSEETLLNLDFKSVDFTKTTEINLDSNWEFYWNELLAPKELKIKNPTAVVRLKNWTEFKDSDNKRLPSLGFATYKLRFSLAEKRPNLSLYIPRVLSSYKLWINGVLISEMGKVGRSKSETTHRRFTKIIPLNSEKSDFEIVLQVANFYNKKGGIIEPIILGTSEKLFFRKFLQITADMIFIGSIGFIGIFFLLFYVLYWNKDKAVLYFSILCIAISYHTLNDRYAPLTVLFDSISWVLVAKIEYLSIHIAGIFASLFFATTLAEFHQRKYLKIIITSMSSISFLVLVLPPPYFTEMIFPFLVLMLINGIYVIVMIVKAIIAKNKSSVLLFISMILATFNFLAHILFFLSENEHALIFVKFGYVFVFLLLSMLLMLRFSISFKELEKSKELVLQQQKEILITSKELTNVNLKLEENLALLKNYNTELNDFNHIVSHDLKTPLIAVFSLVSFIEEDLKETLTDETKYHLILLKNVVSKMEASIKGLLKYSKAAKGNKKNEFFSITNLLNKVSEVIDYQRNSDINILFEDVEIYANKIELEHVFQNLISNAIKYNDKKKTIVTILLKQTPKEYVFTVSDNGPGIDKKYHKKIFEIYSQLQDNKENDFESSGVGLAIVKKIISKNYGKIMVISEKNKGLTIHFTWKIPKKPN